MAIEKVIPKDIRKYEPKLVGPFTTRQVMCLMPAVILSVGIFMGLSNILNASIRFLLITIVCTPILLLGWYKPYNLPLEKFIKTVFVSTVLAPKYRRYRTKRLDESSTDAGVQRKKTSKKKKISDPLLYPYK